jgi:hypothetical protein
LLYHYFCDENRRVAPAGVYNAQYAQPGGVTSVGQATVVKA